MQRIHGAHADTTEYEKLTEILERLNRPLSAESLGEAEVAKYEALTGRKPPPHRLLVDP